MLNHDIVRSVNIDRAVETPMNRTAPHIRSRHIAKQMEMNGIATQPIGLAHIVQFDVGDPGCEVILVVVQRAQLEVPETPQERIHPMIRSSQILHTNFTGIFSDPSQNKVSQFPLR